MNRRRRNTSPFYLFNRALIRHSNLLFRGILATPPVRTDPGSEIILFSLLQKTDINAYLLSAKSFLRYCGPLNVVIQNDGSIDHGGQSLLRKHLPGVQIIDRSATETLVRTSVSPSLLRLIRDTNWFVELKLLNPLVRFPGKYVILFDADLLFLRRPTAVLEALASNPKPTFYCPGGNVLAEPFRRMGIETSRIDLRSFNSGFVGFHNSIEPRMLEPIADTIRQHDPSLFNIWDMEQALFGALLGRTESPFNLKSIDEEYVGSGWSNYETLLNRATMCHFVGATRFRNLMYLRLARQVTRQLKEQRGRE